MTEDFVYLKDTIEQETASLNFKDKVKWLGKWIRDNYNFISVTTLYTLFYNNYGWDTHKIRYAIKLLDAWGAIYLVGCNTFVVNKNYEIGRFGNKPVFTTSGKFYSVQELKKMFPDAIVVEDSDAKIYILEFEDENESGN